MTLTRTMGRLMRIPDAARETISLEPNSLRWLSEDLGSHCPEGCPGDPEKQSDGAEVDRL